jgi:hypothetical protein
MLTRQRRYRPKLHPRTTLTRLSNDVAVSAPNDSNGRPSSPEQVTDILANLPRTRPQRSTARRTAARNTAAAEAESKTAAPKAAAGNSGSLHTPTATPKITKAKTPPKKAKATPKAAAGRKAPVPPRTSAKPKRPSVPSPAIEPAPAQGFESESDRAHGPVSPPSGTELVASATEMLGELAKVGLSAGERLLKDVFSHLPLS